jgi:8-oxo-dGTP diphosphatase
VSVAHIGLVPTRRLGEAKGSDDASDARWWPIVHQPDDNNKNNKNKNNNKKPSFRLDDGREQTGPLAFDHDEILTMALDRVRKEAGRFAAGLLGSTFTAAELSRAHEALTGEPTDARALCDRLVAEGFLMLVSAGEQQEGTEGEPVYSAAAGAG